MTATLSCPALMIAAPASGQGKTTVTAALARLHRQRGRRVRVFKCGPDFLDPQIHAIASGAPCENLDFRMCGESDVAWRLSRAARDADLILIEGVMGLFDGAPSAAELARRFDLPILVVIDGGAMARSFGAIALGLKVYEPNTRLIGALANSVASDRHTDLLRASLPEDINWYGAIPREASLAIPERHLGVLPAAEIDGLSEKLDLLANSIANTAASDLPPSATFPDVPEPATVPTLAGKTIAIARDAAFCFIYPANIECLHSLGAKTVFFSPLTDSELPPCDAVWIPGGYPELHPLRISKNRSMAASLVMHVESGKPLLAECGGMMAIAESLTDLDGVQHPMIGLIPGTTVMQRKLVALGMQTLSLQGGCLGGHTFHYSTFTTPLQAVTHATKSQHGKGEAVFRHRRLTATYFHAYFPSAPAAAAHLFSSTSLSATPSS